LAGAGGGLNLWTVRGSEATRADAVVGLRYPFVNFMTATERGGSRSSNLIDVIGIAAGAPRAIRYARIRI